MLALVSVRVTVFDRNPLASRSPAGAIVFTTVFTTGIQHSEHNRRSDSIRQKSSCLSGSANRTAGVFEINNNNQHTEKNNAIANTYLVFFFSNATVVEGKPGAT